MGRKEEMFQYAREKLTPYISERANLLRKDCAAYLEMKREYHRIVSDLLQTAQKRQAAGTLGQIHYFSIFYLQSSAVTQSYDFALSLTNERYCLDQNGLLCFWCPQRLFQAVEEDLSFFEKMPDKCGYEFAHMSWKKSAGPISITCISWPASSLVRNLWMLLS